MVEAYMTMPSKGWESLPTHALLGFHAVKLVYGKMSARSQRYCTRPG